MINNAIPQDVKSAWNVISKFLHQKHIHECIIDTNYVEIDEKLYYIYALKSFENGIIATSGKIRVDEKYLSEEQSILIENIKSIIEDSGESE